MDMGVSPGFCYFKHSSVCLQVPERRHFSRIQTEAWSLWVTEQGMPLLADNATLFSTVVLPIYPPTSCVKIYVVQSLMNLWCQTFEFLPIWGVGKDTSLWLYFVFSFLLTRVSFFPYWLFTCSFPRGVCLKKQLTVLSWNLGLVADLGSWGEWGGSRREGGPEWTGQGHGCVGGYRLRELPSLGTSSWFFYFLPTVKYWQLQFVKKSSKHFFTINFANF